MTFFSMGGMGAVGPGPTAFAATLAARLPAVVQTSFGDGAGSLAPAAVVLVARDGVIAYEGTAGGAGPDLIFDLASVTKAAATAPLLMRLVDAGTLGLDRRLVEVLPEWEGGALEGVTLRQLLTHRAGLWEWRPTYLHARDPEAAIAFVLGLEPRYPPGSLRAYSDLGLMVAGEVVRRATGRDLAGLAGEWLWGPLGLSRTAFRPPVEWRGAVAASSLGDWYERRMIETGRPHPVPERAADFNGWREHRLVGEANDGNAFHSFGGAAGHAGLFSSAFDLAQLGMALGGAQLSSRAVLDEFMREASDEGQGSVFRTREVAGRAALWHPGFTGTRWLVAPDLGLVIVLLSNRLNVEGEPQPVDSAWDQIVAMVEDSLIS